MNSPVNERVNGHGLARRPEHQSKPDLIAARARELLNLRRLPAMLTVEQTAALLNCGEHNIPVLVKAGLLVPLGNPQPNSVKRFASVHVLDMAADPETLGKVCNVIAAYWSRKNAAPNDGSPR